MPLFGRIRLHGVTSTARVFDERGLFIHRRASGNGIQLSVLIKYISRKATILIVDTKTIQQRTDPSC